MKQFFILLGLSICLMSLSAQEAYQYNQFYYQRSTLFEKLPIDSDDIVFLGNSITNGREFANGTSYSITPISKTEE